MALNGDFYYDKIGSIQQSMQKSAKQRQELEQELFALSTSDETVSQIKCSKLRSYLKEICDREARAKMRNLELLKHVECIEINMKDYCHGRGPLQQQKAETLHKSLKFMDAQKEKEKDLATAKSEAPHKDYQHGSQDSTQLPGKIFVGSKPSREAEADPDATSVDSHRALHPPSNSGVLSCEHIPSGLLKDYRVGGEDASSKRAHLSDDISGAHDSPDKHESMSVEVVSVDAGDVLVRTGDDPQPSPLVTLTVPEKNLSPSHSPMSPQNSPAEQLLEAVQCSNVTKTPERGVTDFTPETTFGQRSHDAPDKHQNAITPSSDVELSESSDSYISISLTQSESEEDPPEDAELSDKRDSNTQHSPELSVQFDELKTNPHSKCDSAAAGMTLESLSQEGLFNLLESIEGRLHGKCACVYRDSSVNGKSLNRIISLCNSGADLNDEDLEACGAVVLHEIQRLSWSTAAGCLLPPNVVTAHQSSTEPEVISTSLPPDAAWLWDRWFKHALLLKEQRVLTVERLVQLFTPLLVERHATYSHQAKVLLRTLLSQSSEECSSAQEKSDASSSSGGLPAAQTDKRDMKPAGFEQKHQIQELQSTEEDSQDESPVESVPIRATKAYQRLKQSAMQERVHSSEEEEEEVSGINHSDEEDLGRADRPSHQDPYPWKGKTNSMRLYATQSKDFWGESDDSNSEIEAALRPQPLTTDTDDFYD
ncbi:centrosomal protein kizuna [Thalassophryne amazonica]|uniref:centrosomal protein kizuna n=1 Tax=Thalassophryne amazonica TaxID=390379 RepID=UPI001471B00B|nr:centrosomal protein kizuna [Thalassophryne amazonica]